MCVPGCTLDECFAGRPPYQRQAYELLAEHVSTLGPYHADVVKVGVFLKHESKFAEVRPKARSLSLALELPHRLEHPRVARALPISGERWVNFVKLTSADDVDDEIREWLTAAYDHASI